MPRLSGTISCCEHILQVYAMMKEIIFPGWKQDSRLDLRDNVPSIPFPCAWIDFSYWLKTEQEEWGILSLSLESKKPQLWLPWGSGHSLSWN